MFSTLKLTPLGQDTAWWNQDFWCHGFFGFVLFCFDVMGVFVFPPGLFIINSLILLDLILAPSCDSDSNDHSTEILTLFMLCAV